VLVFTRRHGDFLSLLGFSGDDEGERLGNERGLVRVLDLERVARLDEQLAAARSSTLSRTTRKRTRAPDGTGARKRALSNP